MKRLPKMLSTSCTLAVVAIICAALGCSKPPQHAALAPGTTVVALGDSITYGTGATRETSYPAWLARITGWNVVNGGVPGELASQGCARISELAAEHRPRLILVLLGGNDFLRRSPDEAVVDGLRICIRDAREAQTDLVLLTVPRLGANGLVDAPLYADIARRDNVPLLDSGLSELLARRSLRADLIHLNDDGYRQMAEHIAEGLRALGYVRR